MASSSYGMTLAGFIPKRLADIQNDMNASIALIVDPHTGEYPFQNVTDDAVLQQVVGVFASALEEAWEAAYEASVQFDPQKNTGAGQSGTVQLNAITRKAGTKTILTFDLTGTPGVLVPAGALIASASGETAYALQENVIFPAVVEGQRTSHTTARGVCTEYGAFDPGPGTVNTIQTPVAGWFNASNTATESVGTAQETDEELRKRQQRSTQLTSYRQIDAIYASVLAVEGVTGPTRTLRRTQLMIAAYLSRRWPSLLRAATQRRSPTPCFCGSLSALSGTGAYRSQSTISKA